MRLKQGSKWGRISPEIILAVMVARDVFGDYGYELVLTEGTGGGHMEGSLHYFGQAVDIRTRHVIEDKWRPMVNDIRSRLTTDYDVVLEPDHLHIEYDPK